MRRVVAYPTNGRKCSPAYRGQKCNCLTAYYSHGVGGFDLRPFILGIKEKNYKP